MSMIRWNSNYACAYMHKIMFVHTGTDTIRHRIAESHANKAPAASTSNNQYLKKKQTVKPPAMATTALIRNNFRHRHN